MKRNVLKIAALLAVLVMIVAFSASCDILTEIFGSSGVDTCTHAKVTKGSCTEYPTCLSCGETVGKLADHDYTTNVVAPTCLEDGYTEYVCKVCNNSKKTDITSAVGHTFGAWEIVSEPTEDKSGEMKRECSECDFSESETIAPHEHKFENESAKAATCTEIGWSAYEYCTECNYSTKVEIRPIGHAWGEYASLYNDTHKRVCANDPSHILTEPCSNSSLSENELPVCEYCNTEFGFEVRPGNNTYGYYSLGEYSSGDGMKLLYRDLTEAAEKFFFSDEDVSSDQGYYIIGGFDINNYSINMNEAMAVWKVFYVSSPAYYWLDAAVVSRGDEILLTISDLYASASERRECDAAIEEMANDCSSLIEDDMSDLEKSTVITSFIVKGMEYAYEADGVTPVDDMWAHNMTGLAVHGLGVCESYAKSFTYLCLLNGVDCAIGSGYAGGEAHAWNYVKIGDEWYGVDVTWTDNSGDEVVFDKFGLSSNSIFADHQPHSSSTLGVEFIYEAPKLSDKDIELTSLYKDGEYLGMYKSIDDAFLAMTDTEAEYEIYIGYYSSFVGAQTHTVTAYITPSAKKITITGKSEFVGEGYLDNNSIVYLESGLTLASDLVLQDISIESLSEEKTLKIRLDSYTLTLDGASVYVDARIEGLDENAKLVASTERGAYIYKGVNIYRLAIESDKIVLGADSRMVYSPSDNIYTQNGAEVKIERYT